MSLTSRFDEETKFIIDQITRPWTRRVVDRRSAEDALGEHFKRLGMKPYPVRWAPDGAYGYIDAFQSGGVIMGITNDAAWLNKHKSFDAKARERVWDSKFTTARNMAQAAWTPDDDFVLDRMFMAAQREPGSNVLRLNRRPRQEKIPLAAVVRQAATGIGWSEFFAKTDDPVADELSRIWMPFVDMLDAGVWFCWIVNGEAILVERPKIYRDDRQRFHRLDGPAIDWNNGKGLYYWGGVEVDEDLVMHPERITIARIDRQANIEVRRVMIERYGMDRYLKDSNAEVVHQDNRGTLYRKVVPNDEPIVVVKVKNSTPEPDGTFKDYFIRVPPTIQNASHAVAWTFGIEPDEFYDPLLET